LSPGALSHQGFAAEDISRGWKVLRGAQGDAIPSVDAIWVDLETSRSREYRLSNFYEPGLQIWLERTINLSAAEVTGYWIVSVPNRLMIDRAFMNGQPLKDVAAIQNNKEVMTPETRAIYEKDPYKTNVYDMGISVRRRREMTHQRWDVPALLLVDGKTLKPGANRLLIQGYDYDLHGELLGKVELRRPTIADRIAPFAYHLPQGATGVQTIVGVTPRVPGPYTLNVAIEVQDYFGATLRRDTRRLTVTASEDATFVLPQAKPEAYKAIVTYSLNGENLRPYWVYFQPRLDVQPARTSFSLEGWDWTVRALKTNDKTTFPLDNSGARPTYVPGIQRGIWEWYQWDVRQMILRKSFALPQEIQGNRRLLLSIGDVRQTADVYLNGQSVGRVSFNEIPRELDISSAVKRRGENEIVVVLGDAETMADALNLTSARKTFINGAFRRAMLLGSIKISAVPEVRVLRTWVTTSVATRKLTVKTFVENASAQPVTVDIENAVLLKDKPLFALKPKISLAPGQSGTIAVERAWPDAQLYTPWSPTLYGLKTTATVGGRIADQKLDRFGFRELTIEGDQILLNGKPLHGLGHEFRSDGSSEAWPLLDFHREVAELRDIKALGYTYLRRGKIEPRIHDLHDEIGIFTSLHYGPWDNGQGDVGTDDETVALYAKEPVTNIPEIVNHPSITMYNYGNEVYHGGNRSEKLALSMYEVVKRIKQTDPTRPLMTQGSDDIGGRADVIGAHYWNYVYLGIPLEQIPAELRERTTRFDKVNWDRHKPVNIDEFSWILPRAGYPWYGEAAMKQTPFRQEAYRPDRLHDIYPMIAKREREFQSYRRAGVAAFAAFSPYFITNENIKPVLALFTQENTRFWAKQPIMRTIDVFNDSGKDANIEVSLLLTQNGKTTTSWKQTIKVPQGRAASAQATIPAINVDAPTDVRAELVTKINNVEQSRRVQNWTIFPKSWMGSVNGVTVGVFDPHGSAKGLFEFLGAKPVVITNISDLSREKIDVLVIGENIDAADVSAAPDAIAQWVNDGGQALVLRQKKIGDWMPVPLTLKEEVYGFETFLYAVGNPLVNGLLPEDFWRWGNAELVNGMAYDLPRAGTVRVLTGKLPADATLMEARYGSGRFIINALELTANKVAQEPAAARLLANILRAAKSEVGLAPTKALVLSGTAGPRTEALKDKMRLEADFATQPPASLDPYRLIILTDNENAPPADFAPKLRAWVNNGGTLVVQNVTTPLQKWLETALGVQFTRKRMEAVRAHKIAHDPLLNGISDGDLAWRGHSGEWAIYNRGISEHDIIREEVLPEGTKALTFPAVLAKKPIGQGQLIVDQSRWAEVTNKGGEEWGLDSRLIAARLQNGLLMNLGAYFNYPERQSNNLVGLAFEPLNIEKYFNRSRLDETAADGKGWIDLGNRFDLDPLPSGVQRMGGVPFAIADEAKTGGHSVIMLRSAEQFKNMPEESAIVPVGKGAKSLFFLHTAAYANSKKGTTAWEYEIRYEGHSKLIPGSNFAPFTAIVPVQAEVDVADWLGRPLVPAAWSIKHAEGNMNLYMQRWDNPRPDTPIESIVIRSRLQKEVPLIFGITLANEAQNLVTGDFAKVAPFNIRMKNFDVVNKTGSLPLGWSTNAWHNTTVAEVFSGKEPTTGEMAAGLRNLEGRASIQFYLNPGVPVQAGKSYT
ncbi:MAG: hypothetical protein M3347_11010, partial [Armatimonadota bacterium]|nr:hypothetical protein [Armatimonadota bacterium]